MSKSRKQAKADAGKTADAQHGKGQSKSKLTANLILAGFCLYALILAVLTVDQIFHLGLYPPKLDRNLQRYVEALGDPELTPEQKQAFADQLISYHEFSIPHLIDAVEEGDPEIKPVALQCLREIGARFFNADLRPFGDDPARLRAWHRDLRAKLDAAIAR